ncbi:nuclear transport factor 2 family protein [Pleionea sediminis]|uniref:nuclear transport factor 2 family protein n=1 Tax=Pleionea sediminis TaxID=2569479 RepID=UPI0011854B08|nr:nuclear transport factor 2 family protein [Pleionea sediminis]
MIEAQINIVDRFIETYGGLNASNIATIESIYTPDIEFVDPLHQIEGIAALKRYMELMYSNVDNYSIDIKEKLIGDGSAFLVWEMRFSHPRLNKGKMIEFDGASQLKFEEKIAYHRDFYDAGQMLYEHLPLLGRAIQIIKNRVK